MFDGFEIQMSIQSSHEGLIQDINKTWKRLQCCTDYFIFEWSTWEVQRETYLNLDWKNHAKSWCWNAGCAKRSQD